MALKVIVTGQPRTGTSFLTNLVSVISGYSLGPKGGLKTPDGHNPNGYFENEQIMQIEDELLQKMGGSYQKIPETPKGWHKGYGGIKKRLRTTINRGKIEVIKSPRGIMMGDIYHDMYPKAIWFYTRRDPETTYGSRWGKKISRKRWRAICKKREEVWKKSKVGSRAWNIEYDNFKWNFGNEWIKIIQAFWLEGIKVDWSVKKYEECKALWKPRNK